MTEDKPQEEKGRVIRQGKGSIILEILIVIAFFMMIASIYIPKSQWEKEEAALEMCREKMSNIEEGLKYFYQANNFYTDTLSSLINFMKADHMYKSDLDSVLTLPPDSLYSCPQTGQRYLLTIEEQVHYDISCPNEDHKIKYWLFFTKEIKNHGNIKDGAKSWE